LIYQLCLIENVPEWEENGWIVATGKVVNIGGWHSVWMKKKA
jgi:hypothetical protein